jgi:ribonuclease HI
MMAYISRLSLLKKALKKDYDVIVTERSVLTDKMVFAKMLYDDKNIEEIEYSIYLKWFDEFIEELPELKIVYVQTDPIIAKTRVDKRAREGENIPLEYLINCDKYHNDWLYNKELGEMLIIDGNKDINLHPEFINIWVEDINNFAELTNKIKTGNYLLRFDGGSRGNPGLCGAGYVLILGLKCAIKNNIKTIHIQGDSLLVINQIKNIFACNSNNLKPLLAEVYSLLLQFDDYCIEHISRDINYYSDKLANKAMDDFKINHQKF